MLLRHIPAVVIWLLYVSITIVIARYTFFKLSEALTATTMVNWQSDCCHCGNFTCSETTFCKTCSYLGPYNLPCHFKVLECRALLDTLNPEATLNPKTLNPLSSCPLNPQTVLRGWSRGLLCLLAMALDPECNIA